MATPVTRRSATPNDALTTAVPPAGWDAVTVLTVFLVLLIGLPTDLRLATLGGAGVPAFMLAMAMGLWWCWSQVHRRRTLPDVGGHPVRRAAFVFLGLVLASYVAAMERALPRVEASQADIGVLRVLIMLSILLVAHDGIRSMVRMQVLLRRFVWLCTALALLGLLQFVSSRSLIDWISIPGFSRAQSFSGIGSRNGFIRAAGTAMNPLEYGTALSIAFPIALTLALYRRDLRLWSRWVPTAMMGAALLVSGSRSSLLGLAVGFVVLFFFWGARIRLWMSLAGLGAIVAVILVVPGLLGTMRYLFTNTANDTSVQSRSGSYELVGQFVAHAPIFGRGFGTYLPEYRILDNAYLSMVIDIGTAGLIAYIVLVFAAVLAVLISRQSIRHRPGTNTELDRAVGSALIASLAAAVVLTAFFDAFAFPMSAGTIFLTIGLCGAYRRLLRLERASPAPARPVDATNAARQNSSGPQRPQH